MYSFCVAQYQLTHGLIPVRGPELEATVIDYRLLHISAQTLKKTEYKTVMVEQEKTMN